MNAVLPLTPTAKALVEQHDAAPQLWQVQYATERMALLKGLLDLLAGGYPQTTALELWGQRTGKSAATGRRWLCAYLQSGEAGLQPNWRRPQNLQGMEAAILRLYNSPNRPNCGTIALWLRQQAGVSLTAAQIRRFIANLPAVAAEQSPRRMGAHEYAMKVRPYIDRDPTVFEVGEAMHSDGHCMKFWCLHPVSGKPFRFEFTPVMDIRSNFVWGYWVGEAESSLGTIFALCSIVRQWQHAPKAFFTDPGAGFKNARVQTLLGKLGVTHVVSRSGNSRGRGFGEGFHKLTIERFAKRFQGCCSRDKTDDTLARFETKWKHGIIYVPTLAEVLPALADYIDGYNRTPQPYSARLGGLSPQQMVEQSGFRGGDITIPAKDLLRVGEDRMVRGSAVRLYHRRYVNQSLLAYEKRQVRVEHELTDLTKVYVYDADGRFVCEAARAEPTPYVSDSFLTQIRAKSDAAKLKLLRNHSDEVLARSNVPLSPATLMEKLEAPQAALPQSVDAGVLAQGHSIFQPEPVSAAIKHAKPINPAFLARLNAELDEEDAEVETETAADRYARARALQAAETLAEADANWLAIYTTSPEFRAQRLLAEAREEERAQSAATDAPSFFSPQEQ